MSPDERRHHAMIGSTVGQYRIVAQLGRGSAGTVYRAIDETLEREVAIKILNPDLVNADMIRRFRTEATTLARLSDPAIATIYELFQSEADLLMVMEFVRGETLGALSERLGPMAPDQAACLVDQVLRGLGQAHHAGVVHRDVKPVNVMVTTNGGVKIMDFGIARVRGAQHATAEGCLLGTPAYMAPEQVLRSAVDARADLYSVGVIFYRLLTSQLPFDAATPVEMLKKQVAELPTPLPERRQDLPAWCDTVMQRALSKNPEHRFQSADEFRTALAEGARILTPLPPGAVVPSVYADATPPARIPHSRRPAAPAKTLLLQKQSGRRAAPKVALVATVMAVLGYLAVHRDVGETAPSLSSAAKTAPETVPTSGKLAKPTHMKAAAPQPFKTRVLIDNGTGHEYDGELVLARENIRVTVEDDGTRRLLHAVPYKKVISISYSRGRDPLWMSPTGPAPVTRAGGGVLGLFRRERHWIALRTSTTERFVILRANESTAPQILDALEGRTGRKVQVLTNKKG